MDQEKDQIGHLLVESVEIRVGTGDKHAKVFHADQNTICCASKYFEELLSSSTSRQIDLADEDPLVFDLFLQWARSPQVPICFSPGQYSKEPWISNAVSAWFLARKLGAAGFEDYALSQFIQNCALAAFGPWEYIENKAPSGSPLRRFSDQWVAWNAYLSGPGINEFTGLGAAAWGIWFVSDRMRDPRFYDIEHWHETCGSHFNPNCFHDPVIRQQRREEENRRRRPQPLEWGRSFEEQRGKSSSASSTALISP
jgi:hypothetical protein